MRLALLALVVLTFGCGTVVPYSLAPGWLAPDLVPEQPASVLVVTDRSGSPGGAVLAGRVVDRRTGEPIDRAVVSVNGDAAGAVADARGAFAAALTEGPVRVRVEATGYLPAVADVEDAPGARTTVLVLLAADPAAPVSGPG